MSVIEPAPWWPSTGMLLILRDVDARAGGSGGVGAGAAAERAPHFSPSTSGSRPEADRNSIVASTRRSISAGGDVATAAVVDLDLGILEDALGELGLGHQQDLADGRVLGAGAEERIDAGGAVDGGGLEQLPAVEDRLGIDLRGVLAGRLDLEVEVRGDALRGAADPAEDRPGDHDRAAAAAS